MTSIILEARPGADPNDDKETETLTGEATRRIRQSVLDGELEPNARLNEVHLCDSLSISRAPPCRHWLARDF
jgi:DNA-binding GntR family transcriptional regulator